MKVAPADRVLDFLIIQAEPALRIFVCRPRLFRWRNNARIAGRQAEPSKMCQDRQTPSAGQRVAAERVR